MTASTDPPTWSVKAEMLTRERFAPFGEVIGPLGLDPVPSLYEGVELFRPGFFESDEQPVECLVIRLQVREFRVLYLERHLEQTQMCLPLGHPLVLVVARPDAREDNGLPVLDELHAFLLPAEAGVSMKRGTWHEPPFALTDGAVAIETSSRALTEVFRAGFNERHEIETDLLVKRHVTTRTGYAVRVALP